VTETLRVFVERPDVSGATRGISWRNPAMGESQAGDTIPWRAAPSGGGSAVLNTWAPPL